MLRILTLVCALLLSSASVYAERNTIVDTLDDTRHEIGNVFAKKGTNGQKSLRETTSEAWHWLWQ